MNIASLIKEIKTKKTYLCVGLDTDIGKLPAHLQKKSNAVFEFNKAIIDATKDHCVSYKINTAFYESQGIKGWEAMEETLHYIPSSHFTIADAKRGDIGNTAAHYAKTFFETFPFDAITVNPYMGEDSVRPFLDYKDKVTIVLGLTSNKGAEDFELQSIASAQKNDNSTSAYGANFPHLFELVLAKVTRWGTTDNLMFVAGATQKNQLQAIRKIVPDHFLLVPGIGAQGGSLKDVAGAMNRDCGLLVNASRAVIFASSGEDFALKAAEAAKDYQSQMQTFLTYLK